jgi:hypothetical protein
MCCLEPANLSEDLGSLRIGADAIAWYQAEIDKFSEMMKKLSKTKEEAKVVTEGNAKLEDETWEAFSQSFLLA